MKNRISTTEILSKDFKYMLFVRATKEKYTRHSKGRQLDRHIQGLSLLSKLSHGFAQNEL